MGLQPRGLHGYKNVIPTIQGIAYGTTMLDPAESEALHQKNIKRCAYWGPILIDQIKAAGLIDMTAYQGVQPCTELFGKLLYEYGKAIGSLTHADVWNEQKYISVLKSPNIYSVMQYAGLDEGRSGAELDDIMIRKRLRDYANKNKPKKYETALRMILVLGGFAAFAYFVSRLTGARKVQHE